MKAGESKVKGLFADVLRGRCNAAAVDFAWAVVENPFDERKNPLVLTGPCGSGKTHLLNAMKRRVEEKFGPNSVAYYTLTEAVHSYAASLKDASADIFSGILKAARLLILDDADGLMEMRLFQEIVLEVVDYRIRNNLQTVFASTLPVHEFKDELVNGKLLARLASGTTVKMSRPDKETIELFVGLELRHAGVVLSEKSQEKEFAKLPLNFWKAKGFARQLIERYK